MNPVKTLSQRRFHRFRRFRGLTALAAAAALCACGSGGGDGADAAAAGGASSGGSSSNTAGSGATGSTGTGSGSGSGSSTGSGSGSGSSTGSGSGSSTGSGSSGGSTGAGGSGSGSGGSTGAGGTASGSGGSTGAGGSGSGSGSGGGLPPGAASVPAAGTLQIGVPTANYPGGSTEGAAWRDLNTARQVAGAGQLMQSTALDTAAAKHANYLARNLTAAGHDEDPAKIDYYEATPASRISKAGFGASLWAETLSDELPQPALQPFDCAAELLNTVYNAAQLLGPATHVGLSGWDGSFTATMFCVAVVAAPTDKPVGQVMASGKMTTYPYDGQSGVADSVDLRNESPRPSATVLPNGLAGTPVIVNLRNADYLNLLAAGTLNPRITRFTLTDAGGNLVPAALLAHAGLRGSGVVLHEDAMLPLGAAVLVPLSPLPNGQTYTVSFSATLHDGGPVLDKTWNFRTR